MCEKPNLEERAVLSEKRHTLAQKSVWFGKEEAVKRGFTMYGQLDSPSVSQWASNASHIYAELGFEP